MASGQAAEQRGCRRSRSICRGGVTASTARDERDAGKCAQRKLARADQARPVIEHQATTPFPSTHMLGRRSDRSQTAEV